MLVISASFFAKILMTSILKIDVVRLGYPMCIQVQLS